MMIEISQIRSDQKINELSRNRKKIRNKKLSTNRKLLVKDENTIIKQTNRNIHVPSLPAPEFDPLTESITLSIMENAIQNTNFKSSILDNKFVEKQMRALNKKINQKLQKAEDQRIKQEKQHQASGILGWLGAIFGIVFGAIAAIFTGGAGIALMVAGVMGLTMCVLNQTGTLQKMMTSLGKAIAKSLVDNGLMSKKAAKKWGALFAQIVVASVVVVATVVTAVATGGVGAMGEFSGLATTIGNVSVKAGIAATSAVAIASGAVQIAATESSSKAEELTAEGLKKRAIAKILQNIISDNIRDMKDFYNKSQEIIKGASNTIKKYLNSQEFIISSTKA